MPDGAFEPSPPDPPFDDPADGDEAVDVPPAPLTRTAATAPRVVVLGAPADVAAVARAVALRLAGTGRRAAAVVATWCPDGSADGRTPGGSSSAPARGGATRLAATLADEGHAARTAGRLVHVRLGLGPEAASEAERVADTAGAPVVLALGGARGAEWDRLLPEQDVVLLAVGPTVPTAMTAVALAGARDLCGPVPALAVSVGAGRRPRVSRDDLAAALQHLVAG